MKKILLPTPSFETDAVIIANGDFPSHPIPLSIIRNSKFTVCCDGAVNNLALTGIQPDAIVGDCDSLSIENREKYADIIYRIEEQETNDLTKSVNFCIERGLNNIIILGATGKREDHTIANIGLLADYTDLVKNISMISEYGVFNVISENTVFESFESQQVSLFCINPTHISSQGLKYPIENRLFTNWWQATLNEAETTEFKILTSNKVIIFRVFA